MIVRLVFVEFFVDGTWLEAILQRRMELTADTRSVPNGTHALTAVAHDSSDNTTTSATVTCGCK